MTKEFDDFVRESTPLINKRFAELITDLGARQPQLAKMMAYSFDAGGKRVRPLMLFAILKVLRRLVDADVLTVAVALEAVHTYSLIHDDLPAMDNDDLRRGRPTSHKQFGEAEAILTGDALLTVAFQWLATTGLEDDVKVALVNDLAQAAGPGGMVAGQLLDIEGNQRHYSLEQLKQLHELKTGQMLIFPAKAALHITKAETNVTRAILQFVQNFGLAFQIHDDIIDVTESSAELGKTAGKDQALNKNTYVNLLGLANAKERLATVLAACEAALKPLAERGYEVTLLRGFLTYLK
ncbi:polyprenyl synthetase family protein [Pediococcus acidilactici]